MPHSGRLWSSRFSSLVFRMYHVVIIVLLGDDVTLVYTDVMRISDCGRFFEGLHRRPAQPDQELSAPIKLLVLKFSRSMHGGMICESWMTGRLPGVGPIFRLASNFVLCVATKNYEM